MVHCIANESKQGSKSLGFRMSRTPKMVTETQIFEELLIEGDRESMSPASHPDMCISPDCLYRRDGRLAHFTVSKFQDPD